MKNKKFKLPSMDFSSNKSKKKVLREDDKMLDSNIKQSMENNDKIEEIIINDSFNFSAIEKLKLDILENDNNIIVKLINIKEIDLSGIQFILSIKKSRKNITFDVDYSDEINMLLINTGFSKLI